MRVLDTGVVIELLCGSLDPVLLGDEELAVPHLLDSEVLNVLRRLVRRGTLSPEQGQAALDGFGHMVLARYPAHWLGQRVWELRDNLTAYDATYVALAELSGATELLTTDRRIARAAGVNCPVTVLG